MIREPTLGLFLEVAKVQYAWSKKIGPHSSLPCSTPCAFIARLQQAIEGNQSELVSLSSSFLSQGAQRRANPPAQASHASPTDSGLDVSCALGDGGTCPLQKLLVVEHGGLGVQRIQGRQDPNQEPSQRCGHNSGDLPQLPDIEDERREAKELSRIVTLWKEEGGQ